MSRMSFCQRSHRPVFILERQTLVNSTQSHWLSVKKRSFVVLHFHYFVSYSE